MAPTLGLVALAVVSLSGCGSTPGSGAPPSAVPSAEPTAASSPIATLTPSHAPTFVATGSMHDPRAFATATLLQNGQVLMVGGAGGLGLVEKIYASAELYDPSTGKFAPTGSMASARSHHTATLLRDGRVLLAGGIGCGKANTCATDTSDRLASAELYDPTTGTFSPTGSMSAARSDGSAARLNDGRVFLFGGLGSPVELYDPTSGQFSRTGDPPINFGSTVATSTLLLRGRVLVTFTTQSPEAGLFDPATERLTRTPFGLPPGISPSTDYDGYDPSPDSATLLQDGRVLLYGPGPGYLETYDPATGAFAPAGTLSDPGTWGGPTSTLLTDGRVLFAGGWGPRTQEAASAPLTTAVLYDPASGPRPVGPMTTARGYSTATLLSDGSVLIVGGLNDSWNALASAELFRP
jgi:hypothetical protein